MASRSCFKIWIVLLAAMAANLVGCANVQVPAIDPTGARIFSPGMTTLEAPCNLLTGPSYLPRPAFSEPPAVPNCEPTVPLTAPVQTVMPQPRPTRGVARPNVPDRLVMTPSKLVAPVGTEVVLLAGLCGADGYYLTKQPIEWTLSQESVGNFMGVGEDNHPRLTHLLHKPPKKMSSNYAIARSSTQARTITRGTPAPSDDIWLQKGQSWITLTSASEGTSHVTALAANSDNWEQRRQTATVQWVDAQWVLPPPAVADANQPHVLTTTITRSTTGMPVQNWQVRYTVISGPRVEFDNGSEQSFEARTVADGAASARITPIDRQPGVTQIRIEILSPSLTGLDGAPVVIGQGMTTITWSAAGLAVSVQGPTTAAVGSQVTYQIQVTNPGDLPAEDVRVSTGEMTDRLRLVPGEGVQGNRRVWDLGTLGPHQTRLLTLNCEAQMSGDVRVTITANAIGVSAEDQVVTEITETALRLVVELINEDPNRIYVGDEVSFNISVTNTSNAPITNVVVRDIFDTGLEQSEGQSSPVRKSLNSLAPGGEKHFGLTFTVREAGLLQHTVEVTADGGHSARTVERITAVEPRHQLSVLIDGPETMTDRQRATYDITVTNTGDTELSGLNIQVRIDDSLNPVEATPEHGPIVPNLLRWLVAALPPNRSVTRTVTCDAVTFNDRAEVRASVVSVRITQPQIASKFTAIVPAEGAAPVRPEPREAEADVPPTPQPPANGQLLVELADATGGVRAGETIVYTLVITNDRQVFDDNIQVQLRSSDGLRIADLSRGGQPVPSTNLLDAQNAAVRFREMRPGESIRLRIEAQATAAGEALLEAIVSSDLVPQGVSDQESTPVTAN